MLCKTQIPNRLDILITGILLFISKSMSNRLPVNCFYLITLLLISKHALDFRENRKQKQSFALVLNNCLQPVNLSEFITGIFLGILQNFPEQLLYRTPSENTVLTATV